MQPQSVSPDLPRLHAAVVAVAMLLALVGLADLMVWQVTTPRLGLALLALSITAAAYLRAGPAIGHRAAMCGWVGMGLATLPVIEEVQSLSVLFLIMGVIHAAGWFVVGSSAAWALAIRASLRLCGWAALRICVDLFRLVQATTRTRVRRTGLVRLMRDWAVPLGLGGLFVLLFLNANPVLEVWGQALTRWSPQIHIDPGRAVFWGLAGALIWPFLRLDRLRTKLQGPARVRAPVALPDALFNPRSVLRALLTFNLIFALQTGLDLAFLWGGVSLPAGMTFATYAHKGAYPLVATALLAGGFALIAQPFLPGRPVLRGLLFLWTVQNILLVISSILRLDLYVETYGLTRLRFAAFVWMGLVVAGLVLMIWQVWRGRPVGWLYGRAALMGLGTLYACCFINVAGVVATFNLSRPPHTYDHDYLCALGPGAAVALAVAQADSVEPICPFAPAPFVKAPQDLREWGYRNDRLRNSLAALAALP